MIKDTSVLTIDVGGTCLKVAEFFVGENNDSITLVNYAIKELDSELAEENFAEAFKQAFTEIIQENEFSAIDLNLFLDTHPDSKEALELYTRLCATLKSLKADYVSKYGPLCAKDSANATPFQWVETGRKWPWQK